MLRASAGVCTPYRSLRARAGRGRRRLGRALLGGQPVAPAEVPLLPDLPTWRPLTTPDGWSIEDLRASISSFSIDGSPAGAHDGYWEEAFGRFLHTYQLARDEKGRALELGANPYILSWLLTRFTDLDLSLGNYFGVDPAPLTQRVTVDEKGDRAELVITSEMFNIEEDDIPHGSERSRSCSSARSSNTC